MEIIAKNMQGLSKDTNKRLDKLSKMIENTNGHFTKELQSMKTFQSEIPKIKNHNENVGSRTNQCENRISELEASDAFKDQVLKEKNKIT